jgi:hypothetical protein
VQAEALEPVFQKTHDWGKAAKFFRALGFTLEFETDHNSGQLRDGIYRHRFSQVGVASPRQPATRPSPQADPEPPLPPKLP